MHNDAKFSDVNVFRKKDRKKLRKLIDILCLEQFSIDHIVPASNVEVTSDTKYDLSKLNSFSDIYEDTPVHGMSGTKVKFEEIVNREIIVIAFKTGLKSRFKRNQNQESETYTAIQFAFVDDPNQYIHIFNTGSEVLREKLLFLADKLPFTATIIKDNRCLKFK